MKDVILEFCFWSFVCFLFSVSSFSKTSISLDFEELICASGFLNSVTVSCELIFSVFFGVWFGVW